MNLISGKLMNEEESREELERLQALTLKARKKAPLPVGAVIRACDTLSQRLGESGHLHLMLALGIPEYRAREELYAVKRMMSRQYLESRMKAEFGAPLSSFSPYGENISVRQEWRPIGVLLHIAAGNADALPAFSVIEGLLTGNINILKLPGNDDGLSVAVLRELIAIEPSLAPYVFVFDYPSSDLEAMKKLMDAADAIVLWGGDAAVSSVRRMAGPDTRIIEWGHKLSFAYVSGQAPDSRLEGIAENICDTDQLLCNSCQGIFIDTESFNEALRFSERFIKILERVSKARPRGGGPYLRAQKTLEVYTEKLEAAKGKKRVFRAGDCSVIAYDDMELSPSYMFRNCWVRPLPRERLLPELCRYKNHLQTAALICGEGDKEALEAILEKTGVVRVTSGARMSKGYCGMPHDGEFSLRRYMKIMSYEY